MSEVYIKTPDKVLKVRLYKDSRGYWYYDVRGEKRLRKSTGCKNKEDAVHSLRLQLGGQYSLFNLLDEHLDWKETVVNISPSWLKRNKELRNHVTNYFGDVNVSDIKGVDIEKFFKYCRNDLGLSKRTVQIIGKFLRQFFTWCVDRDYLNRVPKFQLVSIDPLKPRDFTDEEIGKILNDKHLQQYQRDIILFILNTGLRISELRQLKPEDCDLKNNLIRVVSTATRRTKTRREREIPLNDLAREILEFRLKLYNEYVFTNRDGSHIKDPSSWMYRLMVRAKLKNGKMEGFHSLRHTFATRLRKKGMPLEDLKEVLGHESIQTTLIYANYGVENLRNFLDKL
jgi:integrase